MWRQLETAAAASWKNVSDTALVFHDLHVEITNVCLETLSSAHWQSALSVDHSLSHTLLLSCLLLYFPSVCKSALAIIKLLAFATLYEGPPQV